MRLIDAMNQQNTWIIPATAGDFNSASIPSHSFGTDYTSFDNSVDQRFESIAEQSFPKCTNLPTMIA